MRRRGVGDIVIRDAPPPSLRRITPKREGNPVTPKREEKEWTPPLEYKEAALQLRNDEDPEEFPGQRIAERASFEAVPLAMEEFTVPWSAT